MKIKAITIRKLLPEDQEQEKQSDSSIPEKLTFKVRKSASDTRLDRTITHQTARCYRRGRMGKMRGRIPRKPEAYMMTYGEDFGWVRTKQI